MKGNDLLGDSAWRCSHSVWWLGPECWLCRWRGVIKLNLGGRTGCLCWCIGRGEGERGQITDELQVSGLGCEVDEGMAKDSWRGRGGNQNFAFGKISLRCPNDTEVEKTHRQLDIYISRGPQGVSSHCL